MSGEGWVVPEPSLPCLRLRKPTAAPPWGEFLQQEQPVFREGHDVSD